MTKLIIFDNRGFINVTEFMMAKETILRFAS